MFVARPTNPMLDIRENSLFDKNSSIILPCAATVCYNRENVKRSNL